MTWQECWYLIKADLFRLDGTVDLGSLAKHFVRQPSTRFLVLFRIGTWARAGGRGRGVARLATSVLYSRWSVRYGLEIPFGTLVGPGLKISHRIGGVIVNPQAILGAGVTLTPGVVVGNNAGSSGAPSIGDGVVLSVGSKIIGAVQVGDRVQVGANSVVTHDVESDRVVAGVPARVLDGRVPLQARHLDFEAKLGLLHAGNGESRSLPAGV